MSSMAGVPYSMIVAGSLSITAHPVKVSTPGVQCQELWLGKVRGSSLSRDHNYLHNYL